MHANSMQKITGSKPVCIFYRYIQTHQGTRPCTSSYRLIQVYWTFGYFIALPCTVMYRVTGNQGFAVSEIRVNDGMYLYVLWYMLLHTYRWMCVLVHTIIYCNLQEYTSTYQYILVYTCMYPYILVHTGTYCYILVPWQPLAVLSASLSSSGA